MNLSSLLGALQHLIGLLHWKSASGPTVSYLQSVPVSCVWENKRDIWVKPVNETLAGWVFYVIQNEINT